MINFLWTLAFSCLSPSICETKMISTEPFVFQVKEIYKVTKKEVNVHPLLTYYVVCEKNKDCVIKDKLGIEL